MPCMSCLWYITVQPGGDVASIRHLPPRQAQIDGISEGCQYVLPGSCGQELPGRAHPRRREDTATPNASLHNILNATWAS